MTAPVSPPLALIIIDMQQGMRRMPAESRNNPQAEATILRLLRAWRAAGQPVVHVRHISLTPGSPFWPGQDGAEFQPELQPLPGEHVQEKNVPDVFIHSQLERWLRVRGIQRLVITGVSTNNSVEACARSAGNLGFDTLVVADGCYAYAKTDFDGVARSAQQVHAMALANLHGEYAQVIDSEAALALLA
ncbi:cysteine hydrolase family protein [Vogesella facilis]|uniref:Cysteine hydrolase family protein n=1 Tax=Vogesella facilis TaxID=1655232 RepID=A0ABV7RJN5_9NEIS